VFRCVVILLLLFSKLVFAQDIDLSDYEWKNRIVLIVSDESKSILLEEQLLEFKGDNQGFYERKLLVLDVRKDRFRRISFSNSDRITEDWEYSSKLFNEFSDKNSVFKVLLIGLDGGVKERYKNETFPKSKLFEAIDGMFLRKLELNQN